MFKTQPGGPIPSPEFRTTWRRACEIALNMAHPAAEPGHLWLALLERPEVRDIFALNGVGCEEAGLYAQATLPPPNTPAQRSSRFPRPSRDLLRLRRLALAEAARFQEDLAQPGHQFLALLRPARQSQAAATLKSLGFQLKVARSQVDRAVSASVFPYHHPLNWAKPPVLPYFERAHELARSTHCGRIGTGHILLALLEAPRPSLTATYALTEAQLLELRNETRRAIHSDGEIGGAEYRFSPAAKRVLDHVHNASRRLGSPGWGYFELFGALHPRPVTWTDRLHYGSKLDDPAAEVLRELAGRRRYAGQPGLRPSRRPVSQLTTAGTIAIAGARMIGHPKKVTNLDLLDALAYGDGTVAAESLRRAGYHPRMEITDAMLAAQEKLSADHPRPMSRAFSAGAKQTIRRASQIAQACGRTHIGPEHLLLALLPAYEMYWVRGNSSRDAAALALANLDKDLLQDGLGEEPVISPQRKLPRWVPSNATCFTTALLWCAVSMILGFVGRWLGSTGQTWWLDSLGWQFLTLIGMLGVAGTTRRDDLLDRTVFFGTGMLLGLMTCATIAIATS